MRKIYKGINYNKTIIKVLILQGSTRANGNTAWMAEEYKKAAVGQWKSHLLIVNHHLHQFAQTAKVISLQREYGRGEFYHREVGCADGVAHRGQAEREVLVAQQADAAVVAGGREDGYLEAGRIGIEVALVQRQFAIII